MKAILVIDLPDGTNVDDIKVLYKLTDISTFRELYYSTEEYWNGCSLKPMPQKKKIKEIKHLEDFVNMETQYDYIRNKIVGKINYDVETIFNEGYNSCIDKILGEEE